MKSKSLIVVILGLALVWLIIGLRAPATPDRFVVADSQQYMRLATRFMQTGTFAAAGDLRQDLMRAPGYPLFLVVVHLVFGAYKWASLVQALLGLANCLLIFRIPVELGCERKVGYAGVILYLLSPNAAFYPMMIMTETLTSFLLMVSLWSVAKYLVSRRIGWLALSGLVMSLAAFVRPANLPLFIIWCLLLLGLLAFSYKVRFWKAQVLRPVLVFLISGLALVLAWQARNYLVHGRFTFSTVGSATLKYWIAGQGIAEIKGITREQAEYLIRTSPDPNRFILQTIRQNLGKYLRFTARGLIRTGMAAEYRNWAYDLTGTEIQESGLASGLRFSVREFLLLLRVGNGWILLGLYATVLSLVVIGLIVVATWRAILHRRISPMIFNLVVVALVSILFITITPLGHGSGRFRVPVEPYMALLAGLAYHRFVEPVPAESLKND